MKRKTSTRVLAVVLGSTLVFVSGCLFKSADKYPTPQKLSDNLLVVTDMPSGWAETQRQVFDVRSNENPSIDPSMWCPDAAAAATPLETLAGGSGADVEMNLSTGGFPKQFLRLQAWSNADASAYMDTLKTVVNLCAGKTTTDELGVKVTTTLITGRDLGDESISWSDETTPPAGTEKDKLMSFGRTTVVRYKNVIMVMQFGNAYPVGTTQFTDEATWWDYVSRAGKKLSRVA